MIIGVQYKKKAIIGMGSKKASVIGINTTNAIPNEVVDEDSFGIKENESRYLINDT